MRISASPTLNSYMFSLPFTSFRLLDNLIDDVVKLFGLKLIRMNELHVSPQLVLQLLQLRAKFAHQIADSAFFQMCLGLLGVGVQENSTASLTDDDLWLRYHVITRDVLLDAIVVEGRVAAVLALVGF